MQESNHREIVFLIADLSGFTALTEAHGDMSAVKVVTRYIEIVNDTLYHGTQLVERVGDEVLIVGDDATNMVQTATSLRDAVEKEQLFPCIHAGIHAGGALKQDNRYFGKALNLASRVAAHARGGQILCTEKITSLSMEISGIRFQSLGLVRFKNISEPVTIYEIVTGNREGECTVFDPVCHMHVQEQTAPARLPFRDRIYYFCSLECAKAFAENPGNYLDR